MTLWRRAVQAELKLCVRTGANLHSADCFFHHIRQIPRTTMNVQQAARAYTTAREGYYECFKTHFENRVQPLDDDRFWQLLPVFVQEIRLFRLTYGRTNGVPQAAEELFRKPLAKDFVRSTPERLPTYTLDEAMQFAKSWEVLIHQLYPALHEVVANHSDDTFGDLLDNLLLLGREFFQQAVSGGFKRMSQLVRAVHGRCRELKMPARFVLEGENYLGMNLYEAARESLALETLKS
jgi:hypothetical protein